MWEYRYEPMGQGDSRRFVTDLQELFHKLGEAGWEHSGSITTDEGEFIVFKRPRFPEE